MKKTKTIKPIKLRPKHNPKKCVWCQKEYVKNEDDFCKKCQIDWSFIGNGHDMK
jgi:hypothetical protein